MKKLSVPFSRFAIVFVYCFLGCSCVNPILSPYNWNANYNEINQTLRKTSSKSLSVQQRVKSYLASPWQYGKFDCPYDVCGGFPFGHSHMRWMFNAFYLSPLSGYDKILKKERAEPWLQEGLNDQKFIQSLSIGRDFDKAGIQKVVIDRSGFGTSVSEKGVLYISEFDIHKLLLSIISRRFHSLESFVDAQSNIGELYSNADKMYGELNLNNKKNLTLVNNSPVLNLSNSDIEIIRGINFIFRHELSHLVLGHFDKKIKTCEDQRNIEIEADLLAVFTLNRVQSYASALSFFAPGVDLGNSGYSVGLLPIHSPEAQSCSHPQVEARLRAIRAYEEKLRDNGRSFLPPLRKRHRSTSEQKNKMEGWIKYIQTGK